MVLDKSHNKIVIIVLKSRTRVPPLVLSTVVMTDAIATAA